MKRLILISLLPLTATGITHGTDPDFSQGVFIVNEDWYGHQNSTVNYFDHKDADGNVWQYRVVQQQNPGRELGCTNQYGQIYGDKFFLVAKQEKDPGAAVTGGRISVADARTMKLLYQSTLIDPSGNECDGRACLGVDRHKVYISASNGVWIFDADNYEVTGMVEGSSNSNGADGRPNTDPTGSLYHGQCGSMVRVNDRVFVAHQAYGLLVIDPYSDKVVGTVTMETVNRRAFADGIFKQEITDLKKGAGIGSVVLAKDGSLWLSVAYDIQGRGATLPYLVRVDAATLDTEIVRVPGDMYPPANSWYAWTPDGFHASTQRNVLYWNGGPNSWFTSGHVYRYDIDSGKFDKIIDLAREAEEQGLTKYTQWQLYGCSMRTHPVTDEMYLSLYHYFQNPTYKLRRTDHDGNILGEYDMIQNYWFPSLPVFPDNAYPEVRGMGRSEVSATEASVIDLAGWASDADNMDAAIVKTVAGVSDAAMFDATMDNGNLVITPRAGARGNQWVKMEVNSNGHVIYADIDIAFVQSGIDDITVKGVSAWYAAGVMHMDNAAGEPCTLYGMSGTVVARWTADSDSHCQPLALAPGLYLLAVGRDTIKIVVK